MATPTRIALAAAALYLAIAIYAVVDDRGHPGFLSNMQTFLVTAPISLPLSWIGLEPNLDSLGIAALLVAGNTMLIHRVALALARVFMPPRAEA